MFRHGLRDSFVYAHRRILERRYRFKCRNIKGDRHDARFFDDKGLWTFSWRLSGRIVAVFSREERERAVELYFTTSMSTKQVVEHLGYPTRQCLERWLHADPRYADVVCLCSMFFRRWGVVTCICLMVCVPVYRGFIGRVDKGLRTFEYS